MEAPSPPPDAPAGLACGRCGAALRRPAWGRGDVGYLCPACGAPLAPGAGRSRWGWTPPAWALYGLGALLLCGAIARVAADRLTRRPPPTPVVNWAPAPPPPEPDARELLPLYRARAAFFDAELKRGPGSALHLREAAETALAAGFLLRESQPQEARRWWDRARALALRLRDRDAAAATSILNRLNAPRSLNWRYGSGEPGAAAPALGSQAPLTSVGLSASPPPPGAPGGMPVSVPPPPGAGPVRSPTGYAVPPALVPPPTARPSGPSTPTMEELWTAFREHPENPTTVDRLGQALEDRVAPGPVATSQRLVLEEAVRVYRRGAERAPLRLHRATFLLAAARALERLGRHDEQRGVLEQAVKAYPHSWQVWRELSEAYLRLGMQEESARADRAARRWRLPRAVFPG